MCLSSFLAACKDIASHTALVDPDGTKISYEELLASYQIWQDYLSSKGIAGETVAVQADFSSVSVSLLLALIQNRCTIVPIQKDSKCGHLYRQDSACAYLFNLNTGIEFTALEKISAIPGLVQELRTRSSPGLILFSSGSTGHPKGAVHDLNRLLPTCLKKGRPMLGLGLLLFDHIGGFNTLFRMLGAGGTLVCLPDRKPLTVCRAIEQYNVELLPATPTFLHLLLMAEGHKLYNLSSLKTITYGTEPMPQVLLDKLCEAFPNCTLKQTYGLSELGILPTKSLHNQSLWLMAGGNEFETRVQEDGTLQIKSSSAMLGYLNASSPFDAQGWFTTGDKVIVRDGALKILGRDSDIINVGGEKVYPAEVENILMHCPGVLDARVSGEKNPLTGEMVVADIFVEEKNNSPLFKKTVLEFCATHLDRYKIPLKIKLVVNPFMGQRLKKNRKPG